MTSFSDKIAENKLNHAYVLGAHAFNEGHSISTSPYEKYSDPDKDWINGFLDAMFIRKI